MKKVMVVGSGGSGKSTLSVWLADELRLPVYHLDRLYWQPNWVKTEKQAWVALQHSLCEETAWIIDGNYQSTLDIRLAACDTVIFLDVNRLSCIYRALKRSLISRNRHDLAEGCNERVDFGFLKFLWYYPRKSKPLLMEKLAALDHEKTVIIATSAADALQRVRQQQHGS